LDTSLIGQFKIKISDCLSQGKNSKHRSLQVAVVNRTTSKWTAKRWKIFFSFCWFV